MARYPRSRWVLIYLLYAGGLLCWEGARLTVVSSWWLFELLDIFAWWISLPGLLVLLMGLPRAPRVARLCMVVPLILVGWEYGGLFLPQRPVAGAPLRVMTANLLVTNHDSAGVTDTVVTHRPDVLAVQELRPAMASQLAQGLTGLYPYQILEPNLSPFGGQGVFSRYPVRLRPVSEPASESCFCQRVSIDLPGRSAILVHVHPPRPDIHVTLWGSVPLLTGFDVDVTQHALQEAIQGLEGPEHPLLVVGDFNVSDRQPFYRELRHHFADAYRDAGWGFGFTFPNAYFGAVPPVPLVRIDYILRNEHWGVTDARTGTMPGSDHRFLLADLVVR